MTRSYMQFLTKMIKGAALALAQFHKHGGHHDIKYDNFIVSRNQHPNADIIDVKLIDFNLSNLHG
uniref:Protein kinase domain-containing protein n=1 Tax=Meloidogyne enterolobii TaxID=390850 RepID=A0A6V7X5F9_MELEN|nr:unnamed protein product [Meloidogyne enterolobii]